MAYLTKLLIPLYLCAVAYVIQVQFKTNQSSQITDNSSVNNNNNAPERNPQEPITITEDDAIIATAGDIACDPQNGHYNNGQGANNNCQMKATSDLLVNGNFTAVLPLGDNQYEYGELANFQASYDPTWGRVKSITYPVAGNHEYYRDQAQGYYQYFGTRAGDPEKGYYSYDLGKWHLIALNSNCSKIGGCDLNSPQSQWLKEDLEVHPTQCTLAYFHHPRFSSGSHGNNPQMETLWDILDQAGVELVLSGHDHHYERFAPQDAQGNLDQVHGIRQFVVGTGGRSHYVVKNVQPHSEVSNSDTYGVLQLTLHSDGYSWQFLPVAGSTFTDQGRDRCHFSDQ
jgi:acid phosphatase type 7